MDVNILFVLLFVIISGMGAMSIPVARHLSKLQANQRLIDKNFAEWNERHGRGVEVKAPPEVFLDLAETEKLQAEFIGITDFPPAVYKLKSDESVTDTIER